jgi:hypothetical protein
MHPPVSSPRRGKIKMGVKVGMKGGFNRKGRKGEGSNHKEHIEKIVGAALLAARSGCRRGGFNLPVSISNKPIRRQTSSVRSPGILSAMGPENAHYCNPDYTRIIIRI